MNTSRKVRRLVGLLAALCAVAVVVAGCTSGGGDSKTFRFGSATPIGTVIAPKDRMPAPDLDVARLTGGGKIDIAKLRGKPVVLAFWASWCPPCRTEMPQLDGLHRALGTRVTFVGVNTKDARGPATTFLTSNKISFPAVYDQPGDVALKLGNIPGNLPFTVVIDKTGKVAAVYLARYGAKDLSRALTSLRTET